MDANTQDAENREAIGGNNPPDWGKIVADEMAEKYAGEFKEVADLLGEAVVLIGSKERGLPPQHVTDDDSMGIFAKIAKRLRDANSRLESHRVKEAEKYLRGKQAVDRTFFGWMEKCTRQKKTDPSGAADILLARVDDYMQRKLAAEEARRAEEARKAREEEDRLTRERLAQEEAARQSLAAAERARKPENVEGHQAAAADAAAAAIETRAQENVARERTVETTHAAAAKPADLVGTRVSDNTKVTMARENYCDVTDVALLDRDQLWAFVKDDAKIAAAKDWAKVTQYKRQMPGASIGSRPKTVIR